MASFLPAMTSQHTSGRSARSHGACATWRVLTTLLAAAGVLLIGFAARSPAAHEHVHDDAAEPGHVCAITIAALGYCDTAAPEPQARPHAQAPLPFVATCDSFAWTAPEHWLNPSLAPPNRAA